MWFFSAEAWLLFFRVAFFVFVVVCSFAGMAFCCHLLIESGIRLKQRWFHLVRSQGSAADQFDHLRRLIEEDRSLGDFDPIAKHLTERYSAALEPDWRTREAPRPPTVDAWTKARR